MHRKMHKTLRKYKFISSIRGDGGFDGACLCCYGSVFTPKNIKKRCIYIKGQGSASLIFTCQCPANFAVKIGRDIAEQLLKECLLWSSSG